MRTSSRYYDFESVHVCRSESLIMDFEVIIENEDQFWDGAMPSTTPPPYYTAKAKI